ncbi:MAG: hypothetical protein QM715_10000 [Nibricoccus sp.]
MTGIEIRDSSEAIWDDGEWISWVWINEQIDIQENGQRPTEEIEPEFDDVDREPSPELLFRILAAKEHYEHTLNEISPDWGSIGEAYVAERFGVKLCSRHTQGHDGRLGDELIEIKTITPHKRQAFVTVKRSGNFSMLAVVRITADCTVDVRFVRRDQLPPGSGGKRIVVTWGTLCSLGKEYPPA